MDLRRREMLKKTNWLLSASNPDFAKAMIFCRERVCERERVHVTDTFLSRLLGCNSATKKPRCPQGKQAPMTVKRLSLHRLPTPLKPQSLTSVSDTRKHNAKAAEGENKSRPKKKKNELAKEKTPILHRPRPDQKGRKKISNAHLDDEFHVLINRSCRSRCRICVRCRHNSTPRSCWCRCHATKKPSYSAADSQKNKKTE